MSQASKAKRLAGRARKEAREEKQAKTVINLIFGALIVLALICMVVFMMKM